MLYQRCSLQSHEAFHPEKIAVATTPRFEMREIPRFLAVKRRHTQFSKCDFTTHQQISSTGPSRQISQNAFQQTDIRTSSSVHPHEIMLINFAAPQAAVSVPPRLSTKISSSTHEMNTTWESNSTNAIATDTTLSPTRPERSGLLVASSDICTSRRRVLRRNAVTAEPSLQV